MPDFTSKIVERTVISGGKRGCFFRYRNIGEYRQN